MYLLKSIISTHAVQGALFMQQHYNSPPTFPCCAGHLRDRRSSKMQKFTSKRRRANLKHTKSWTNMHRPVADRAGFVISRMFTVFCLHRPKSIASQRQVQ